jgi:type II secretory pathway component PulJ
MKRIGKKMHKTRKGFSLMELLVAMFISTLIMISVVAAFASAFRAQKTARKVQRDLEDAKTAIEYMAKIIRMSSDVRPRSGGGYAVYMYNKTTENCVGFRYDTASKTIKEQRCTPLDPNDPCANGTVNASAGTIAVGTDCASAPSETEISSQLNEARFYVPNYGASSTFPNPIRRVTVRMVMASDSNARMITTVSLRDYVNLNPTGQ